MKVHEKFKDKGFVVFAVSLDQGGLETVKQFAKKHDIQFPGGVDLEKEARWRYRVRGTPNSFLIGADGTVICAGSGPRRWDSEPGRRLIETLLSSTPSP